jgi:hypothetical protein
VLVSVELSEARVPALDALIASRGLGDRVHVHHGCVIEDWSWAHVGYGAHRPTETPLTVLVFEITMALPSRPA